jgi:hypothetical protein
VHISVAAYLGIGAAAQKQARREITDEDVAEIATVAGPPRGKFVPPIPIRTAS